MRRVAFSLALVLGLFLLAVAWVPAPAAATISVCGVTIPTTEDEPDGWYVCVFWLNGGLACVGVTENYWNDSGDDKGNAAGLCVFGESALVQWCTWSWNSATGSYTHECTPDLDGP